MNTHDNHKGNFDGFRKMDLTNAQPVPASRDTITITISSTEVLSDFAQAFVEEGYRKNPLLAEQVKLTAEELSAYNHYLLTKRVETIHQQCRDFRKLGVLYIPSWVQYLLAMIGIVYDDQLGLEFIPVMEEPSTMSFEEAVTISNKVRAFNRDLQMVNEAMPRGIYGESSVMQTLIIADYVRSIRQVTHISDTYVTAALGFKIQQDLGLTALYRLQYDDVSYIRSVINSSGGTV